MKREEIHEVYKAERSKSEKTRNIQWKFNIALWTLLAAAIWFFNDKKVGTFRNFLIPAAIWFIWGHFLFVYLTQKALAAYRLMSNLTLDTLNKSNDNFISFSKRYFKSVPLTLWN